MISKPLAKMMQSTSCSTPWARMPCAVMRSTPLVSETSTSALFGPELAVRTAIHVLGADAVLNASRRLTKSALPAHVRKSVP
ncbi:hypothetical protein, partial [Nocardia wallacei]|uniref:hypothetical protein n=1 Tax=Nocardia wallacei TaxID=480035 RepID=UPI0024539EA3